MFDVPPTARPYIDVMITEDEVDLVLAIGEDTLEPEEIASRLKKPVEKVKDVLRSTYTRGVVDKEAPGVDRYSVTNFYVRMAEFATFEDWESLPVGIRRTLAEWNFYRFIEQYRKKVEARKRGEEPEGSLGNDTIFLLDEAGEIIDAAEEIVVLPCDCRSLNGQCDRPRETCLAMAERARKFIDRGVGRQLSKEEAKEIISFADKKGLMHTVNGDWRENGVHAICNCCADDCYPFRGGMLLGDKGVWPLSKYTAVYDPAVCTQCRLCVKRCHFGAFEFDEKEGTIEYDPEKCWGCGLCANTCPSGAIRMERL